MGKFDSSRTRVVPVFNALMNSDPTGLSWLPTLLRLGSLSKGRIENLNHGPLLAGHDRWWGKKEKALNPPRALLRWLIEHPNEPKSGSYVGDEGTKKKRERLVAGDSEIRAEAQRLLGTKPVRSAWYILEGQSRPDAYFETENLIMVIEGKRTERESTTATTWMPRRSQMLRHMDAAFEIARKKKVLGLMIVEGVGEADAINPSEYWLKQAEAQVTPQMLDASLPHRTPTEKAQIADGFLGLTTWQRICAEFNLAWPPLADQDQPRKNT